MFKNVPHVKTKCDSFLGNLLSLALTLVYYPFLQELTSWESSHSSIFLQVKMERNFCHIFFKLSKKNLPHGCFHNLATF